MIAIKAHFDGKVFVPDEPVKLPKGKSLKILIQVIPKAKKATKKKGKSVLDRIMEHTIDDPSMPTDFSYNFDHYVYGTPKKKLPKR